MFPLGCWLWPGAVGAWWRGQGASPRASRAALLGGKARSQLLGAPGRVAACLS